MTWFQYFNVKGNNLTVYSERWILNSYLIDQPGRCEIFCQRHHDSYTTWAIVKDYILTTSDPNMIFNNS